MCSGFCFIQFKTCTATYDIDSVFNPSGNELFDIHDARHSLIESQHITAKRDFQVCKFIQLIDCYIWNFIAFEFKNNTHSIFIGFITKIGNSCDDFIIDEVCYRFNQT